MIIAMALLSLNGLYISVMVINLDMTPFIVSVAIMVTQLHALSQFWVAVGDQATLKSVHSFGWLSVNSQ